MVKEILVIYVLNKLLGKERTRKINLTLYKYITKVASLVFFLGAIVHGLRLAFRISINIGGWVAPFWLSVLIVIIASFFAISLWKKE